MCVPGCHAIIPKSRFSSPLGLQADQQGTDWRSIPFFFSFSYFSLAVSPFSCSSDADGPTMYLARKHIQKDFANARLDTCGLAMLFISKALCVALCNESIFCGDFFAAKSPSYRKMKSDKSTDIETKTPHVLQTPTEKAVFNF